LFDAAEPRRRATYMLDHLGGLARDGRFLIGRNAQAREVFTREVFVRTREGRVEGL
jgi:hypothetical protein